MTKRKPKDMPKPLNFKGRAGFLNDLREALILVRERTGLNPREFAKATGFTPTKIYEIEIGSVQISLRTLIRYANAWKFPVSSIVAFSELKNYDTSIPIEKIDKMSVLEEFIGDDGEDHLLWSDWLQS